MIDFRSDTVTKPCNKMKEFMFNAPLGDDVYQEDPSVNKLEKLIAKMANKEDALFVSSGTLSNLLALLSHCDRGDEYICGQDAHIYKYEAGGGAVVGSIQPQPIEFEDDATLDIKKIEEKIKPEDSHYANTKLVCLENTHHGQALKLDYIKEVSNFVKKNNLLLHMDGARIFNALVEEDISLSDVCEHVDSISICLSKGLGTPAGSLLVGTKEFIKKARRYRKMLGGGMRQAGILAAAGIYALENNIEDLERDHINALELSKELNKLKDINVLSHHTNMLFLKCKNEGLLKEYLKENNILVSGYGKLRMVCHRDISKEDIKRVIEVFKNY